MLGGLAHFSQKAPERRSAPLSRRSALWNGVIFSQPERAGTAFRLLFLYRESTGVR